MKKIYFAGAVLCAAVLMAGCSSEEATENVSYGNFTLSATVGADTRTTVADNYEVHWSADDQIYVYGESVTGTLPLTSGSGTKSGTFAGTLKGTADNLKYAVYPVPTGESKTTINLKPSYDYASPIVTNSPMYAAFGEDKSKVTFQHLFAMMRLTINNVPTDGTKTLTLTSKDGSITGDFTLTDNGTELELTAPTAEGKTITVNNIGENQPANGTLKVDIPLPAGTYTNGISVSLKKGNESVVAEKTIDNIELGKGEIMVMPELTYLSVEGEAPSFTEKVANVAAAQTAIDGGAKNVTIAANNIEEDATLAIPSEASEAVTYTINIEGNGSNALTITGGNSTYTTLIINAPNVSVNTSGNFKEVQSTTAPSTLNVKAQAAIALLKAMKGGINVEAQASVTTLTVPESAEVSKIDVAGTVSSIDVAGTVTTINVTGTVSDITINANASVTELTTGDGASITSFKDETGNVKQSIIALGDIMLSDGTFVKVAENETFTADASNPAIGVVACLYGESDAERAKKYNADGSEKITAKGLVLALENATTSAQWASANTIVMGSTWGEVGTDGYKDLTTPGGAIKWGTDGYKPTQMIFDKLKDTSSSVTFPAFSAIQTWSETVKAPENTTGWYMPSYGEWKDILGTSGLGNMNTSEVEAKTSYGYDFNYTYDDGTIYSSVQNNIDSALTKAGAAAWFSGSGWYWSSTEASYNTIWVLVFGNNSIIQFKYDDMAPSQGNQVRCVLAF